VCWLSLGLGRGRSEGEWVIGSFPVSVTARVLNVRCGGAQLDYGEKALIGCR